METSHIYSHGNKLPKGEQQNICRDAEQLADISINISSILRTAWASLDYVAEGNGNPLCQAADVRATIEYAIDELDDLQGKIDDIARRVECLNLEQQEKDAFRFGSETEEGGKDGSVGIDQGME